MNHSYLVPAVCPAFNIYSRTAGPEFDIPSSKFFFVTGPEAATKHGAETSRAPYFSDNAPKSKSESFARSHYEERLKRAMSGKLQFVAHASTS